MKYSSHKDIHKAIRALIRKGWSFQHGSKHGKLSTPSGSRSVTVPVTPSGRNAIKTFYGNIKRAADR